jgi:small-conductance mechanosensitive channel
MEKTLGKNYSENERTAFLKDNCDSIVEKGYMKQFNPQEILGMKESLSETDIQINDLEEEKKAVTKDIKIRLDPLKDERKGLLKNIKQKAEFKKEICYKFVDQIEKMVGFYNSEGDMIEVRPAQSDELQGTIFQIGRTGTNDK